MNKKTVCLAYEPVMENSAKKLQNIFSNKNFTVNLHEKKQLPIAHRMIAFLPFLSENFDLAFILIAKKTNAYFWISKELKMQQAGGYYQNIYPVFLTKADVPPWWDDEEQKFITMDNIKDSLVYRYSSTSYPLTTTPYLGFID